MKNSPPKFKRGPSAIERAPGIPADSGIDPADSPIHKNVLDTTDALLALLSEREYDYLVRYYIRGDKQLAIHQDLQIDDSEAARIRAQARALFFSLTVIPLSST